IFFSYSHEDEALRDRLDVHLSMMKHEGLIEGWHDRRITAGDDFGANISGELEAADIILLLVSADFIGSRYCYDIEMARALERHRAGEARVIPVILRPCDWHSAPFGSLQATPKDGKPVVSWPDLDEAFVDVVKQIRAALPKSAVSAAANRESASAAAAVQGMPRSSNLRLKQSFTEADRDRFLHDAFDLHGEILRGLAVGIAGAP